MKVVGRGVASLIPAWALLPSPVAWQAAISRGPATHPGRVAGTLVWVKRPLHISSRRLLLALQQTHIGCGDQPAGTAPVDGAAIRAVSGSQLPVRGQTGSRRHGQEPKPVPWIVDSNGPFGRPPTQRPRPGAPPSSASHRRGLHAAPSRFAGGLEQGGDRHTLPIPAC